MQQIILPDYTYSTFWDGFGPNGTSIFSVIFNTNWKAKVTKPSKMSPYRQAWKRIAIQPHKHIIPIPLPQLAEYFVTSLSVRCSFFIAYF